MAKALASGRGGCHVEDLREEFLTGFVWPTLRAGAVYDRKYLLGTSMARPIIARRQVEVARQVGAGALAHGCTGKGNDQVRFELTYAALAPELKVIAPWREWEHPLARGRHRLRRAARGPGRRRRKEKIFSRDRNLWHISPRGRPARGPGVGAHGGPLPPHPLARERAGPAGVRDASASRAATRWRWTASRWAPWRCWSGSTRSRGLHGVGRVDLVEDRLVGMKSRGVYETPGGTLLYAAHSELEQLVLDRRTLALKDQLAPALRRPGLRGPLVDAGARGASTPWWTGRSSASPGEVRLKLYKGATTVAGRTSPFSLYDERFVTFGEDDVYDQADAARLHPPLRPAACASPRSRTRRRGAVASAVIDVAAD